MLIFIAPFLQSQLAAKTLEKHGAPYHLELRFRVKGT